MWINLAAEQGDANAGQALDTLARRMTPLQLAKAQKMAQACQARKYKGCE
jgi:hypothetical protein